MISKCFVLLAIVCQIYAFRFDQDSGLYNKPGSLPANNFYGYSLPFQTKEKSRVSVPTEQKPVTRAGPQYPGTTYKTMNTAPTVRNVIAKGKYSVTLQNCGPTPDRKIPVYTTHVKTPVQERPVVRLPAKIPPARTVAHTCTCYKTIMKPRVQQTLITLPTLERYIETTHKPVIENIHYEAVPLDGSISGMGSQSQVVRSVPQNFQPQSGGVQQTNAESLGQTLNIPGLQSFEGSQNYDLSRMLSQETSSQTQKVQTIQLPSVQFVEAQRSQNVEMSALESGQKNQAVELQRVQFVEPQKSQRVVFSNAQFPEGLTQFVEPQNARSVEQFGEGQKNQAIEIPLGSFGDVQQSGAMEMPQVQLFEAQNLQSVNFPRMQTDVGSKSQSFEMPQQNANLGLGSFCHSFNQ